MKKIENNILQKFLDNIVKELKNKNSDFSKKETIDIPFVISSLYQNFENYPDKFNDFVYDLYLYPDYNILILNSQNDYGIIDIEIDLVKYTNNNKINFCNQIRPDYDYKLCFTYDIRDYGYCECTPDMPDYREDKHCCGHGCDAAFCNFYLDKILHIVSGSWNGDEHDYWEFEDKFYMNEKELAEKKEEENREKLIKELKNRIESEQKQLTELEREKYKKENKLDGI